MKLVIRPKCLNLIAAVFKFLSLGFRYSGKNHCVIYIFIINLINNINTFFIYTENIEQNSQYTM